ncbi:hypothetical protein EB796_021181 [Bugula neritina]|uniref:Uncharacterized protein n=1 Tax=Bugula neritina TaxID=10212 RepID=A0A7J7J499_BUGNE|nr:hypothetical protein EB796_021181 [Bugula neritina]
MQPCLLINNKFIDPPDVRVHFVLWQHVHDNFFYGTNLFVDCVSTFSLEQSQKKFGNCIMTSATVVSSSLENY